MAVLDAPTLAEGLAVLRGAQERATMSALRSATAGFVFVGTYDYLLREAGSLGIE